MIWLLPCTFTHPLKRAGKVTTWHSALKERSDRKLRFQLKGKKLQGEYELVFMKEERTDSNSHSSNED
jgi:hypothetical protein